MTPKLFVRVKKTEKTADMFTATVIDSSRLEVKRIPVQGWCTHNEPDEQDRGVTFSLNDDMELIISHKTLKDIVTKLKEHGV